ncbi:tetratricopeptide repeat-containing response regulator [Pseudoduganella chitinolytica]|uniref:Response regulator n=1 Tax=Pseudoduganella chitinolytica TaxID=34070 RepID=A0ABY8BJR9_9BURK|nr:tetratricopeptide repeat-containing response regulator [Pseudoduganella chitinolytica]WEF34494.1 response regulator [Pseudoduganella chitinolytica]
MPEFSELSVLIVDPSPGMRGNLHNMLSQSSIVKIDYALGAGTAIRQLAKKAYDIVLCEYDLDGGGANGQDGQQLLEDLRHHRLIAPDTIFIMLTSEGTDTKVIGAAELTPTDYVLKPFTVETLMARIGRAVDRRNALLPVHRRIAEGSLREALRLCLAGLDRQPRYATEFARLQAETHAALDEWPEAEMVYHTVLALRPATGWAQLGIASCQFAQQRYDDARIVLERLIGLYPRFMSAYDLLARTYQALGQDIQAKKVLEDAVVISPHMVRRLRHLGELAFATDDVGVAERAFRAVVGKARYSEFRSPEDHVNLVRTLVRKGDAAQAGHVIRDLERSLRAGPEVETCRALAAALVLDLAGSETGAAAELERAAAAARDAQNLTSQLRIGLVNACLQHRLDDTASTLVLDMLNDGARGITAEQAVDVFEKAGRHDLAISIGQRATQQAQDALSETAARLGQGEHRAAVLAITAAVRRTPRNVPVLLAAVQTILRQLDELGWEAPLAEQAAQLMARLRKLDPAHGALEHLAQQYSATQRKYGIAAAA